MQYNHGVRGQVGLIGRDHEVDALGRFLDGAGRRALVLRGDAGLGKTALADELVERAGAQGWRVVRATGAAAEQSFALGGLNQIAFALHDDIAALGTNEQAVLERILGGEPVAAPAPMTVTIALLALLTQAARAAPVLLVAEDVHWFDEVSTTVLSATGRRLSDPRVRMLASVRPEPGGPLLEGWDELHLHPLGVDEAARLVDRVAGELSPATRRLILDAAAGNPLALQELPNNAEQIDTWTPAMPMTDRLVTVFGARLRHLDERVRTELLRAALDGTPVGTAARYTMIDVDTAVEQGLLTASPSGEMAFRHPLVRAAVIHRAGATERRAAHAHLAGLYSDELMRRAVHLSAAADGPDQSVADLLDSAAQLSIRRGGAATAVDWLRRAAELSTNAPRREQLRADAAFVASQANRFDDAQRLADHPAVEPDTAAAVLTTAYLALYRDGDVFGSHHRILTALHRADSLDDATLDRMVKLLLAVSVYCAEPTLWQQTDIAVEQLSSRLDADVLLYRDAWGEVSRTGHTVAERLAVRRTELTRREPWEVMRLGVAAFHVDALADFRAPLTQLFQRESERGAITNAMTMLHLLLLDQLASGNWAQAQRSIELGSELTATHRNDLFRHQFTAYRALHAALTGDVQTARRCADDVIAWAGPRRLGLLLAVTRRANTLVALGAGDYATAYWSVSQNHIAGEIPPYSKQLTEELLDLVEAALHSEQPDRARGYFDLAVARRVGAISPRLAALTVAVDAMTTPGDEAGERYAQALAHPGLSGFPFELERVRLAYGMWLRRHRRSIQAREHLTRAMDGFRALGAQPWELRAAAELRAAGAGVKRAAGRSVTLSAQERTIAELAAAGQSNKQIAAALYLSPRTVGAHLYRIFPKLGITSRAALSQALQEVEVDAP